MSYQINLGQWNSIFAVPSSVVDRSLKLASESQLKVLLYILRHAGEGRGADEIACAVGISSSEVENAISFWIERGLLSCDDNALKPTEESAVQPVIAEQQPDPQPQPPKRKPRSAPLRPDTFYTTKRLNEDPKLKALVAEAETALGKVHGSVSSPILVMLHDTYGLPCEVIAMLLNYVTTIGAPNIHTVETIGVSWSEMGIYSVEDAEREIERRSNAREAWGKVSSLIGIQNAGHPTKAQLANASRWIDDWEFNDEMINEAYERCVNQKGTFSLSYMNAILKKWYEKKLFSLDTLTAYEATAKSAKKPSSSKGSVYSAESASFDLNVYESKSLFDDE